MFCFDSASWAIIQTIPEIFDNIIYSLDLHERPPLARTSKSARDAVTQAIWYCADARVFRYVAKCEVWRPSHRDQNMVVSSFILIYFANIL